MDSPDLDPTAALDWHDALALLAWQVELGADEAILDAPVDMMALPDPRRAAAPAVAPVAAQAGPVGQPVTNAAGAVAEAEALAAAAGTLEALRAAMDGYTHCELKKGARSLVFADGLPGARVMVVGEAPGAEEDRVGKPFVGAAGQLLDAMFAAIGLSRGANTPDNALYITNVLPWRPPSNRDPSPDEIAMLRPFLARHIALAQPQVLVVMGNIPASALLGKTGITRLRGTWTRAQDLPCLPMVHPAFLLRRPEHKREAWSDLLALKGRLETPT